MAKFNWKKYKKRPSGEQIERLIVMYNSGVISWNELASQTGLSSTHAIYNQWLKTRLECDNIRYELLETYKIIR